MISICSYSCLSFYVVQKTAALAGAWFQYRHINLATANLARASCNHKEEGCTYGRDSTASIYDTYDWIQMVRTVVLALLGLHDCSIVERRLVRMNADAKTAAKITSCSAPMIHAQGT